MGALSTNTQTVDDVKTHAAALIAKAAELVQARPWPDAPDAVPQVKKVLERAAKDLSAIGKPQDSGKPDMQGYWTNQTFTPLETMTKEG